MSRHSIHISIPQPCHESWDRMDATARGAFCHSCQKEVIDFSAMTDREVVEYLQRHQTSCGRFKNDQLNTKLTIPEIESGIFKWKTLLLGLLTAINIKQTSAQTSSSSAGRFTNTQNKPTNSTTKIPHVVITGIISEENGDVLRGAIISFVDKSGIEVGNATTSDSNGYFTISIDTASFYSKQLQLKGAYGTMQSSTLPLSSGVNQFQYIVLSGNSQKNKALKIEQEVYYTTGITDVSPPPRHNDSPKKESWFRRTFHNKH